MLEYPPPPCPVDDTPFTSCCTVSYSVDENGRIHPGRGGVTVTPIIGNVSGRVVVPVPTPSWASTPVAAPTVAAPSLPTTPRRPRRPQAPP
jgi:hypothetical protein